MGSRGKNALTSLLFAAVIASIPSGVYADSNSATPPGALARVATPPFTCQIPTTPPAADAPQWEFELYALNLFVALNYPAQPGQPGTADCSKKPGSSSNTVWRSFRLVDSIFLPGAADPGKWAGPAPIPLQRMTQVAKASPTLVTSGLGSVMQPVAGWLIDQRGNPTYYQIAVNEISYNYIRTNQLYNAVIANSDSDIDFPDGATEIKASWRILTPDDTSSRYLTTEAEVDTFDENGKPNGTAQVKLGLVGLHIIVKAPGFPQWIWATFEQVDNLTASPVLGVSASYADPNASSGDLNQSPCVGNASPCTPKPGRTFQTPDPLSRVTPIPESASILSFLVGALNPGTFFPYYELVGVQWPSDPNDPGNPLGTPKPNILANTTMESYIQPTSSCMACHSTAVSGASRNKSDFSFLFIHAKAPQQ